MIVQTVMLLTGALATAGVGIPLATRLARPHRWTRHAPRDQQTRRVEARQGPAFEPLDLGPDPMRWPSEVARPDQGLDEPAWPSQTWDDKHFGAFWRREQGQQEPTPEASRSRTPSRPPAQRRARQPQPQPQPQRAAVAEADFFGEAASGLVQDVGRAVQDAVGTVSDAVQGGAPPSAQELERMVGTLGLAGTVQAIMERTGWDFREAAHYLARARQGGG